MTHRVPIKTLMLAASLAAFACNQAAPPQQVITAVPCGGAATTTAKSAKSTGAPAQVSLLDAQGTTGSASGAGTTAATAPVTFYGDLLPILGSSSSGAAYKCTTCHANFNTPDSLNNDTAIQQAISDMQLQKMPRPGDPVPANKIALFIAWQLQGYQSGTPGQAPSNYDASSLIGATPSSQGTAATAGAAAPCVATGTN